MRRRDRDLLERLLVGVVALTDELRKQHAPIDYHYRVVDADPLPDNVILFPVAGAPDFTYTGA